MRIVMLNIAYAICNIYKMHMRYIASAICNIYQTHMRYITYAFFIALIMTYMILNFICYEVWENCSHTHTPINIDVAQIRKDEYGPTSMALMTIELNSSLV